MNKRLFMAAFFGLLVGVILGSFLRAPSRVQAQGLGPSVHVQEVNPNPILGTTMYKANPTDSREPQVIGFSCVDGNGTPHCFIATVQ